MVQNQINTYINNIIKQIVTDEAILEKLQYKVLKNNLELKLLEKKVIIPLPVNIEELSSNLFKFEKDFFVQLENAIYFPFQSKIKVNNREYNISNIYNLILKKTALNDRVTIDNLYAWCWPRDKTMNIDKLYSNLSTLKKYLKKIGLNKVKLSIQHKQISLY